MILWSFVMTRSSGQVGTVEPGCGCKFEIHLSISARVINPGDPITFWEWSWNLNTLLRRWLYSPIIIWQGDWIPRESTHELAFYTPDKQEQRHTIHTLTSGHLFVYPKWDMLKEWISGRWWAKEKERKTKSIDACLPIFVGVSSI